MHVSIPQKHHATVTNKQHLTEKIVHLTLRSEKQVPYKEGQYASFLIENQRRPLSFATPNTTQTLEFIVNTSPNGICSTYVSSLKKNDTVEFLAPYGRFTLDDNNTRPLLLIATGAGIAPLRAHLQAELAKKTTRAITLIFGNRNETDIFLTEELANLAEKYTTFSFIPTLTKPSAAWHGTTGRVTTVVPKLITNLPDYTVYICGNPNMVTDMKTTLTQHNVPEENIYTEQFL